MPANTADHRPRVGIVHPYWTLWEHTAGPTFRADRMALARSVADELAAIGAVDTVAVVEIASGEDGVNIGREFADAAVDVILVLQTMAVPAAWTMAAITLLPGIPVVVWALHEVGLVDGGFDHGSITTQGATVGAPMITNLLSRADRPFELVLGRRSDPNTVARVQMACVWPASRAGSRGAASVGSAGQWKGTPMWMSMTQPCRRATGIELVAVDADEVVERYRAVADADVRALEADVRRDWTFEGVPIRRFLGPIAARGAGAGSRGRPPTTWMGAPSTATSRSSASVSRSASRRAGRWAA